MEQRNYIAFISYRHLPLDMWTAKKLHKRIEHYVIPKDLRRNGEKKVGYVFRDQDELPISSNLNANIQEALDRSEFLIVICTPETVKSRWVLGEIDYFLQHHPRDHILAVLADGTPETAFPPQLTGGTDADGNPLKQIEPLAANILADSRAKRARLFRVESLRILAALIGCPFDALYRREVRYRRQRTFAAVGAGFAVAAVFIGMLLNRNAEIRTQLTRAQINESRALAALSETAYREGNFSASLRYAMDALPQEEGERPFVPEAEKALASALGLYRQGALNYLQSVEQENDVVALSLSEEGELLATLDSSGFIRCYDTVSGSLLWSETAEGTVALQFLSSLSALLTTGISGTALYSCDNGALLWKDPSLSLFDAVGLNEKSGLLLALDYDESSQADAGAICLLDLSTGEELRRFPLSVRSAGYCGASALSDDGSTAALLLQNAGKSTANLILYDLSGAEEHVIAEDLHFFLFETSYSLAFTPGGDLAMVCDDMDGTSSFRLFRRGENWKLAFETPVETEKVAQVVNTAVSFFSSVDFFHCWEKTAVFGSKHFLHSIALDTGEINWSRTLPGTILAGEAYANECLSLVLSNGTVTFCTDTGTLSHTQNVTSFQGGFGVSGGAAKGKNLPESTFALVPDASPRLVALLRFQDLQGMIPVVSRSADTNRICLIPSPSGEKIACVEYDGAGHAMRWTLLDAVEGFTSESQPIPAGVEPEDLSGTVLSDDGELSASDGSTDPLTHELTGKDGISLRVSFSKNGEVTVTDSGKQEELFSSQFREQTILVSAKGIRTDALFNQDGSRLILIYDDPAAAAPVCMVLETDSWQCVGVFEGVAAYLLERDSVLVTPYLEDVYLSPFWNLREMEAQASDILGK